MTAEESIKHSHEVVEAIKQDLQDDVIKDYMMPPLVNMKTGKTTGHGVELQVSTKYDYSEDVLKDWKKRLGADGWNIRIRRNQLFIRFFIHYDKEE